MLCFSYYAANGFEQEQNRIEQLYPPPVAEPAMSYSGAPVPYHQNRRTYNYKFVSIFTSTDTINSILYILIRLLLYIYYVLIITIVHI